MLIPMLDLKTLDGDPVPWNDWWQRRPVALFFPHESCETCARALRSLQKHDDEELDPESIRIVVHHGESIQTAKPGQSSGQSSGQSEEKSGQRENGTAHKDSSSQPTAQESPGGAENGEILGMTDSNSPYPLVHISDPEDRLASALEAEKGTVIAADRFFEIRTSADVHDQRPGQAVDVVFQRIGLAEGECPECGAPVW